MSGKEKGVGRPEEGEVVSEAGLALPPHYKLPGQRRERKRERERKRD